MEKEVNIDFCRAMNRITFDKIVAANPATFSYVTVPEKEVEVVPERGE